MRVIVTRPEPECARWVSALSQRGFDAVALPLIQIGPVTALHHPYRCWRGLAGMDAVMFVSGAAVAHFFTLRPPDAPAPTRRDLPKTRFWAPGPGTVAALVRQGVDPAVVDAPDLASGQFDSEALWRAVGGQVRPGHQVLIVRGDGDAGAGAAGTADPATGSGRDWLARALQAAGAEVEFVVAYERGAPQWSSGQRQLAHAASQDRSLWLFTSSQAVAHLVATLPEHAWGQARALATHPRIAQVAREAGFGAVWESRPHIDDVVASIELAG
jgi:uroporphyrinogen-III synthase